MKNLLTNLWSDDSGAILATEWVFLVTILVIGLTAGFKTVQSAVLTELEEVAGAIGALSQSYSIGGVSGCCGTSSGSNFVDTVNTFNISTCTGAIDEAGANCPD